MGSESPGNPAVLGGGCQQKGDARALPSAQCGRPCGRAGKSEAGGTSAQALRGAGRVGVPAAPVIGSGHACGSGGGAGRGEAMRAGACARACPRRNAAVPTLGAGGTGSGATKPRAFTAGDRRPLDSASPLRAEHPGGQAAPPGAADPPRDEPLSRSPPPRRSGPSRGLSPALPGCLGAGLAGSGGVVPTCPALSGAAARRCPVLPPAAAARCCPALLPGGAVGGAARRSRSLGRAGRAAPANQGRAASRRLGPRPCGAGGVCAEGARLCGHAPHPPRPRPRSRGARAKAGAPGRVRGAREELSASGEEQRACPEGAPQPGLSGADTGAGGSRWVRPTPPAPLRSRFLQTHPHCHGNAGASRFAE